MANVVKPTWFARNVNVLLTTGKSVSGEVMETCDSYIVLNTKAGEVQVMVHAIAVIYPQSGQPEQQQA